MESRREIDTGFLYRFGPSRERITTLLLCVYGIEYILNNQGKILSLLRRIVLVFLVAVDSV